MWIKRLDIYIYIYISSLFIHIVLKDVNKIMEKKKIYIYIYIYMTQNRWMEYNLYISAASCLRQERTNKAKQIFDDLFRFICTFLTKAACCRNIEIVLHPTILSHI